METIIKTLEDRIVAELTPVDRESRFDDMLDELYSFSKIGGPFEHMVPSRVLKEMDPTAYHCGVNDYADGEDWVEVGSPCDNYVLDECDVIRATIIEELEVELGEMENRQDELDAEKEGGGLGDDEADEMAQLSDKIAALKADIALLEKHTF